MSFGGPGLGSKWWLRGAQAASRLPSAALSKSQSPWPFEPPGVPRKKEMQGQLSKSKRRWKTIQTRIFLLWRVTTHFWDCGSSSGGSSSGGACSACCCWWWRWERAGYIQAIQPVVGARCLRRYDVRRRYPRWDARSWGSVKIGTRAHPPIQALWTSQQTCPFPVVFPIPFATVIPGVPCSLQFFGLRCGSRVSNASTSTSDTFTLYTP